MDISVVIPLYNEEESLPELYQWIVRVMDANHFSYEVIFVNDGSTDRSWQIIEDLKKQNPDHVHGIKFRRNYGKSPALFCGFQKAEGDVVITMDADLQDSPDEIPELYRMITAEGYDLVSGWKKKRYDPLSKTIPTKLFNATARKVSGIKNLHDFNCGLKAYRRDVVKVRQDQVWWAEPFLQRLSGPDFSMVSLHLRHQAHALLRLPGITDVHFRLHCRHHRGYQQALLHAQRHALPAGNRLALLLPVAYGHDYRHATLCSRLLGRTHLAQRP